MLHIHPTFCIQIRLFLTSFTLVTLIHTKSELPILNGQLYFEFFDYGEINHPSE